MHSDGSGDHTWRCESIIWLPDPRPSACACACVARLSRCPTTDTPSRASSAYGGMDDWVCEERQPKTGTRRMRRSAVNLSWRETFELALYLIIILKIKISRNRIQIKLHFVRSFVRRRYIYWCNTGKVPSTTPRSSPNSSSGCNYSRTTPQ